MSLVVTSCDEARWNAVREQWIGLQQRSRATPLFLDWDWTTLWWSHFRRAHMETFVGITIHDDGVLIGAVPMFLGTVFRRPALRMRSAHCVGGRLDGSGGMLSEYLDVLAAEGREREVRTAVLRELVENHGCQEVVFCLSREFQAWRDAASVVARGPLRLHPGMTSYQANIAHGFKPYLATLSGSARRSLYNLRRRLQDTGVVEHEIVTPREFDSALAELNMLHELRWGAPAFSGQTTRFHQDLMRAPRFRDRIFLSRLLVGGRCISVLYDVRLGNSQYNLQMGFDPGFNSRVSPGLLHLGYAIEHASESGLHSYDFLGGSGMHKDYKRRLATEWQELRSVQVIAGAWQSGILRVYDGCRRLLWRGEDEEQLLERNATMEVGTAGAQQKYVKRRDWIARSVSD